jgi:hypothetical protein
LLARTTIRSPFVGYLSRSLVDDSMMRTKRSIRVGGT